MRLLFGMVLGAALTVGAAYLVDSSAGAGDGPKIVNWTVAGDRVNELAGTAQDRIHKLFGG